MRVLVSRSEHAGDGRVRGPRRPRCRGGRLLRRPRPGAARGELCAAARSRPAARARDGLARRRGASAPMRSCTAPTSRTTPRWSRSWAPTGAVLGNPAEVLREVRDWALLRGFCRERRRSACRDPGPPGKKGAPSRGRWLVKRVRSGGGHGVVPWAGGALDDAHVLQAEVDGRRRRSRLSPTASESRVFGVCEQLVGRRPLGGSGFTWCGNLLPLGSPARRPQRFAPSSSTWRRVLRGASASWGSTGGRGGRPRPRGHRAGVPHRGQPALQRVHGAGRTGRRRQRVLAPPRRPCRPSAACSVVRPHPPTAASARGSSTPGARWSCPTQRSGWSAACATCRRPARASPPGIPCARCWLAAETGRRALPVCSRPPPRCTENSEETKEGRRERTTHLDHRTHA